MTRRDTALAALSRLPDGGRFVALDSLRGLAALGVAAHHMGSHGGGSLFHIPLFGNGYLFVDFFFVLSGFVLAGAYGSRLASGFPLGRYVVLRLGRIYPLHLAMMGAYLVFELAYFIFQAKGWAIRAPFTGERSPLSFVQSLFLMQAFIQPPVLIWNSPSWSVAVEVWLYLVLALGFRLLPGKAAWLVLPVASLIVGSVITYGYNDWFTPVSLAMARGLLGFGLGVSAWMIFRRFRPVLERLNGISATVVELCAALAIYAAVAWSGRWSYNIAVSDLLFTGAIIVFASERGRVSRLLRRSVFVWLGVLSYSIYMTHMMVVGRTVDLLRFVGLAELGMTPEGPLRFIVAPAPFDTLIAIVIIALCLPAAWVAWRVVENPARLWSRRKAAEWGAAVEERRAPTI